MHCAAITHVSVGTPQLWIGFTLFVLAMLAIDLGVFHRKAHAVGVREAFGWSVFWIALSLVFNGLVWFWFGPEKGKEFLAGYVTEKALSVDNIFVFLVILSYFSVPDAYRHRVLYYGILGALVLRAVFILVGASLLATFHWMIYVFGVLLVITAWKLLTQQEAEFQPERSPAFRLFRRFIPSVSEYRGARFVVREGGRWFATPLLLVLVTIEGADVMFAIDSIPAIFGLTDDPFIVYTSNIFAILGLRALFFLLAGLLGRIYYLKLGLALVLGFVGVKMLISEKYVISIGVSLAIITFVLSATVLASFVRLRFFPAAADRQDLDAPAAELKREQPPGQA
ncbi:MAG: TerC family protein [Planctomycetaceae bacterium]|nr:TerC family protein [Planctomycetaceae bacterium]